MAGDRKAQHAGDRNNSGTLHKGDRQYRVRVDNGREAAHKPTALRRAKG